MASAVQQSWLLAAHLHSLLALLAEVAVGLARKAATHPWAPIRLMSVRPVMQCGEGSLPKNARLGVMVQAAADRQGCECEPGVQPQGAAHAGRGSR